MNGLVIALTLLVTVLLVLAFGIGLSWLAASAVFHLMGHRRETPQSAPLTTAEAGSGD